MMIIKFKKKGTLKWRYRISTIFKEIINVFITYWEKEGDIEDYLFPRDCPERIKSGLRSRLAILEFQAGSISALKRETKVESLANWRDIFLKDMYLSTLNRFITSREMNELFIFHKLEVLRVYWAYIDDEALDKNYISNQVLPRFYPKFSDEEKNKVWNWDLAYQRENPGRCAIDPTLLQKVEENYPNFRDKVRIVPGSRNQDFKDARVFKIPENSESKELLKMDDPELWEGIVISIRHPGDMMIRIEMLNLFWESQDDLEIKHARLYLSINDVTGLGPATHKECNSLPWESLHNPNLNLYGTDPEDYWPGI